MTPLSEYRRRGRKNLEGNWLQAILITITVALVGGYTLVPIIGVTDAFQVWVENPVMMPDFRELFYVNILTIRSTLFWLLGAAAVLGECNCYLQNAKGGRLHWRNLPVLYQEIVTAILLRFLRTVLVFGGLILFVVPGIYLYYIYAASPWILAERPELGAIEAMRKSRQLMQGKKVRLFCLDLSFIGWLLGGVCTLGLGLLYVIPYHHAARAMFYQQSKML